VLALLRKHGLHTLDGQDILDVGCGAGDVLVEFLGYGAAPACLHGVDLLSARLTKARARLPNSALSRADAQSLPYPDDTFSVVLQYTAFSSILDDEVRQNAASEMLRVMKPDGLILWYDFWLNPVNPETRGIKQKEVRHLFPSCRFDFHRTTLAPPVTRVLAKHSLLLCYLLERIPLMCTHYLVAITKRGA
jgi:ubiquinone/menaquinone biosynthesis C-methylase UbiE